MKRDCRYVNFAQVAVLGIGNAGVNSLARISADDVYGVDLLALNTDTQKTSDAHLDRFISLGSSLTRGFGTGGDVALGAQAAERSQTVILDAIHNYDMLFLVSGFGGGTGTGATPIIAKLAKQLDILTVGIIYTPFALEGPKMTAVAHQAIEAMRNDVDTLIVIPNDRLAEIAGPRKGVESIFRLGDEVLKRSIHVIEDLLTRPGIINADFADVRTIMKGQGATLLTKGQASGRDRIYKAAHQATFCPILNMTIQGAKHVLLNITGGPDLDLFEIEEIVAIIQELVTPGGNFIFSTIQDELLVDTVEVMVIASGFEPPHESPPPPVRPRKAAVHDQFTNASQHLNPDIPAKNLYDFIPHPEKTGNVAQVNNVAYHYTLNTD